MPLGTDARCLEAPPLGRASPRRFMSEGGLPRSEDAGASSRRRSDQLVNGGAQVKLRDLVPGRDASSRARLLGRVAPAT
jgi:hypothetical protein